MVDGSLGRMLGRAPGMIYGVAMTERDAVAADVAGTPSLLVLDTSFTFERIRRQKLEASVTCRDLSGFFRKVWTVHPFASMLNSPSWGDTFGPPTEHIVDARNIFIEGKVGRFRALAAVPALNFLVGQAALIFRLALLIRKERIGVIRVGDPHYLGLMGWLLARLTGAKLVIRVCANYDTHRVVTGRPTQPRLIRSMRLEKAIERFLFHRFDVIAGANQDNLQFALASGAPRARSTLFRYGNLLDGGHFVEPDRRDRRPDLLAEAGLEPGRFLISVARLHPIKRPDHVIRALAVVHRHGYPIKAVLAGEGEMRPQLLELARSLGVDRHVILAGDISQERLISLLPQAAALISPHGGRALSEAALAGIPIVAYDFEWQGELIVDGETGLLAPSGDWERFGLAVVRVLADEALAVRLGRSARAKALTMFDPARLDEHERGVYRELLASA